MKKLPWLLAVMLHTASVSGEDLPKLLLEVRATRISRAELEGSLRTELAEQSAPEPGGTLTLSEEPSDVVRISYRDAAGNVSIRELRIAQDDPEALEKVTLAAATLLRSQDDLLAALDANAKQPQPKQEKPARKPVFTRLLTPSAVDPCALGPVLPFGVDLAPGLGSSSLREGRDKLRHVSLGVFGSLSGGTHGVAISPGINIDRLGTCGASLGLVNAGLGPVRGAQLGTLNLAYGGVQRGVQAGVGNAATGGVRGAQLGVSNNVLGDVEGAQVGVANFALGGVHGVQASVANLSWGGEVHGAQLGVSNLARGDVLGLQAGVSNIGLGAASVQLGTLNFAAGDVHTQIGVVNVSRDAKVPIGMFSIVRKGRTSVDAWASETGTLLAGVTHGGRYVHNVYGVGTRVGARGTRFVYTLGIGARALTRDRVTVDIDLLGEQIVRENDWRNMSFASRLRVAVAVRLVDRLSLLVAPGYAFMIAEEGERPQSMFGAKRLYTDRDRDDVQRGYLFPSLSVGLRYMFDPYAR